MDHKIDVLTLFAKCNYDVTDFTNVISTIPQKKVIIWGNCQAHVLATLCNTNQEFNKNYVILKIPQLWVQSGNKNELDIFIQSNILSMVDICIIQQISEHSVFSEKASTSYILSQLPNTCQKYMLTNLYFGGYWPNIKRIHQRPTQLRGIYGNELIQGAETNIISMILDNYTEDEIIHNICSTNYYSEIYIRESIEKEIKQFQKREEHCDIKMADYILSNYDKYQLFVTNNHPTREVLIELCKRLLQVIGIKDLSVVSPSEEILPPCPADFRFPIYPSVLNALNISTNGKYTIKLNVTPFQLELFKGICKQIDDMIGNSNSEDPIKMIKIECNFEQFMRIYIRVLTCHMIV